MSSKQAVVIFSGYNIRAVIAFCRWADAAEVPYHLVARDRSDPIFLTTYKNRVIRIRGNAVLRVKDLCSWIDELRRQYQYENLLILPTTEYLNRFLLSNREAIQEARCIIPLVEPALYETISDKQSFAETCKAFGLDVPKEYTQEAALLPFVAKPRRYSSANGRQLAPYLLMTPADLDVFLQNESQEEFFYQQYVAGRSFYLLAYCSTAGNVTLFSQENLIQQSSGKSIVLARRANFHETETAREYVRMLQGLEFHGLVMIELRYNGEQDRFFAIEANPRLWGPMQLIVDSDIDFFGKMLADYDFPTHQSAKSAGDRNEYYFWSGGLTPDAFPLAYYHYSEQDFQRDLPDLEKQDLFARPDTYDLYQRELANRGQE